MGLYACIVDQNIDLQVHVSWIGTARAREMLFMINGPELDLA
jgi:hypothetical protein